MSPVLTRIKKDVSCQCPQISAACGSISTNANGDNSRKEIRPRPATVQCIPTRFLKRAEISSKFTPSPSLPLCKASETRCDDAASSPPRLGEGRSADARSRHLVRERSRENHDVVSVIVCIFPASMRRPDIPLIFGYMSWRNSD